MGITSVCTTNITKILASDGNAVEGLTIRWRQSKSTTASLDFQV